MCAATLRTPDPATLAAALDQAYDRDEDGEPQWIEHVTTHGMQRIRATLRVSGDELHVQTNSEARLDRVVATVQQLRPDATVTGESRQPADELRDTTGSAAPSSAGNPIDPSDPQILAVLEQMAHKYEQAWLDEPIPALAAQPPIKRPSTRRADPT